MIFVIHKYCTKHIPSLINTVCGVTHSSLSLAIDTKFLTVQTVNVMLLKYLTKYG